MIFFPPTKLTLSWNPKDNEQNIQKTTLSQSTQQELYSSNAIMDVKVYKNNYRHTCMVHGDTDPPPGLHLGAVYMSRASPDNRADLFD